MACICRAAMQETRRCSYAADKPCGTEPTPRMVVGEDTGDCSSSPCRWTQIMARVGTFSDVHFCDASTHPDIPGGLGVPICLGAVACQRPGPQHTLRHPEHPAKCPTKQRLNPHPAPSRRPALRWPHQGYWAWRHRQPPAPRQPARCHSCSTDTATHRCAPPAP